MKMPETITDWIIFSVSCTGLIWYFYCLIILGRTPPASATATTPFQQFQSLSLTTISSTLATYVGMLLGLQTISGNAGGTATTASADKATQIINHSLSHSLQWWAAGLYLLSIFIALYFWKKGGNNTDPAVANLGKSILGLIVGALAIALNLPAPSPAP